MNIGIFTNSINLTNTYYKYKETNGRILKVSLHDLHQHVLFHTVEVIPEISRLLEAIPILQSFNILLLRLCCNMSSIVKSL